MTTSEPGFFVNHFVKDMGITLRETAVMRFPVPGLALTTSCTFRSKHRVSAGKVPNR